MKKFQKFRGIFREILHRNGHRFFPDPSVRRRAQVVFGVLDIVLGILLIALGILGFLLPVLPGFIFFGMGVLLVSPHHGRKMLTRVRVLFRRLFRNK